MLFGMCGNKQKAAANGCVVISPERQSTVPVGVCSKCDGGAGLICYGVPEPAGSGPRLTSSGVSPVFQEGPGTEVARRVTPCASQSQERPALRQRSVFVPSFPEGTR